MSLVLPSGYTDTGQTGSFGGGGAAQFTALNLNLSPASSSALFLLIGTIRLGQWDINLYGKIRNISVGPPPVNIFDLEVRAHPIPPGPGTVTVIYTGSVNAAPGIWTSPTWSESDTSGPYRLGMLYVPPDPTTYPVWAKDCETQYGWFYDFDTQHTIQLSGAPSYTYPVSPTATPADPPVGPFLEAGGWGFGGGCTFGAANSDQILFSGLQAGGVALDTSGLDITNGGNRLHGNVVTHLSGTPGTPLADVNTPYQVRERIGVVDAAGNDLGATVLDPDGNLLTTPVDRTTVHQVSSWVSGQPPFANPRSWLVQAAWALAQDPPYAADDRNILWQLAPPRQTGGDRSFYPVTVDVVSPLSVHRPNGAAVPPSSWVPSGPGIAVVETATETIVTVTDPAASISRTLLSNFPHRIGVFGTADPDFNYGAKEDQSHALGEDVFSWGTYGYQDWTIAGGDDPLTLTVDGSTYRIEDDYLTTGRGYSVTETQYSVLYSVQSSGHARPSRVDLNFPASGSVPFYHGQVRKLTLSGFQVGTYRIQQIDLVASSSYLKLGWGKQVSRYDYSMLHAAVNGASPYLHWGDALYKDPEVELPPGVGGPVRLANIIESPTLGALDTQWTVEELFSKVPGAEGMEAAWNQTAFDAACADPYGNTVGPGLAQWVLPVFGGSWAVDSGYQPACSVVCGSVLICAGVVFDCEAFHTLGGAIEALGVESGARAPSGDVAGAYRNDTGALCATGTTDADGFLIAKPMKQINGTLAFYLAELP